VKWENGKTLIIPQFLLFFQRIVDFDILKIHKLKQFMKYITVYKQLKQLKYNSL